MDKKVWTKVAPIIIVVVAVAAVWAVKNSGRAPDEQSPGAGEQSSYQEPDNPDFALAAKEDFDLEQLKAYGLPIVLEFGAEWCSVCRKMLPTMELLNQELQEKAIIKYIDVDEYAELTVGYPVQYLPTLAFFAADGGPYLPSADLQDLFAFYSDPESGEHALTVRVGFLSAEQMREILADMGAE